LSYIAQCKVDRAAFVGNGAAFILIILKFNSGNNTHSAARGAGGHGGVGA
jgi:hypothetical protein